MRLQCVVLWSTPPGKVVRGLNPFAFGITSRMLMKQTLIRMLCKLIHVHKSVPGVAVHGTSAWKGAPPSIGGAFVITLPMPINPVSMLSIPILHDVFVNRGHFVHCSELERRSAGSRAPGSTHVQTAAGCRITGPGQMQCRAGRTTRRRATLTKPAEGNGCLARGQDFSRLARRQGKTRCR